MLGSRAGAVVTANRNGLDGLVLESRQGQETFSSPKPPRPALGLTQPPIEWVPGILPWAKAAGA